MLVKDEVLLEALKVAQHEPPKTPRVADEPRVGAVVASGAETPREANVAGNVAKPVETKQGELGI